MSLYLGTNLVAGAALSTHTKYNANNLLDFKWSDRLLEDQNWLLANTFSWQDGTFYVDAYNHLVDDISTGTSTTETVGSYTVTYYACADGHKIALANQETTLTNIYNESGVAWYYILDTANQRFKLPRENPAREELIQVVRAKGNGDGLGGIAVSATSSQATDYYLDLATSNNTKYFSNTTGANAFGVTPDSTKSGIISSMTDSTSVYKGKQYLYFYVGQFTQTATEQTAGLKTLLFNNKADVDLSNAAPNASASAKETIVGWGIPDYSAEVSLGEPTTYQVLPCDCYVWYAADTGADLTSEGFYYANSDESYEGVFRQALTYNRKGLGMFLPKGWKVKRYESHSTLYYAPLKGVQNA